MKSKLKDLLDKKAAIMKQFADDGEKFVLEEIQRLFEENPKLVAVGWGQWAPHFNDGDPCVFSVHEMHATFGEAGEGEQEELDIDEQAEAEGFNPWDGWPDSASEAQCKVSEQLSEAICDEDLLQLAFGDDCAVIITRGADGKPKVKSDYYEHD